MRVVRYLILLALLTTGLAFALRPNHAPPQPVPVEGNQGRVSPNRVLVIFNARDPQSRSLANYYQDKRGIPYQNVIAIDCPETDEWKRSEYESILEAAVKRRIAADPKIDYVVLVRGIPFRFSDYGSGGGYSIDSVLAAAPLPYRPTQRMTNPYRGENARFSRATYGILLVTRLDGPTAADARALVDSSLKARPLNGPFYMRDSFCLKMDKATRALQARGMDVEWIEGANNIAYPRYEGNRGPYMAHWGAGPHDLQYHEDEYRQLRFLPGALVELTWSMSASYLRDPKGVGNIALMTANGAAGGHGFVSEPYTDALSSPEVVLDRYTRGFNLAESFAMGSPYLNWKHVVLGDPLCAPYADPGRK